jgi:hypothetical protein
MLPPFLCAPELQTMVEHHLGQQKQGEEPEGASESTGTQEPCPPGIPGAASRLGTSGTAQSMCRRGKAPGILFPSLARGNSYPLGEGKLMEPGGDLIVTKTLSRT